jgi:hypothetical protein
VVVEVGKILRLEQEVLVILLHNLHLKEIMEEVDQPRAAQQAVAVVALELLVKPHRIQAQVVTVETEPLQALQVRL